MREVPKILAAAAVLLASAACAGKKPAAGASKASPGASAEPHAHVKLEPRSGSQVGGSADFVERDGKVTLTLSVSGLTPGEHAFHLHEKGDCGAPDATSAGGHWNPTAEGHGKWGTHPFHRGDVA